MDSGISDMNFVPQSDSPRIHSPVLRSMAIALLMVLVVVLFFLLSYLLSHFFPPQNQNGDNIRQHSRAVECAINEIFDDLLKHTSLQASMCGANKIISAYDCNRLMGKVTISNLVHFEILKNCPF